MGNLSEAIEVTLGKLDLDHKDEALAQLARVYASQLDSSDNPVVIKDIGTRLESVLTALLATPLSRVKSPVAGGTSSRLDEFR